MKGTREAERKQFKFDDVIMWMGCSNYWHVHADCSQPLDSLIILLNSLFNDFASIDLICWASAWFLSFFFRSFAINCDIEKSEIRMIYKEN